MSPLAPLLFVLVGMAGYGWDWADDPARSAFVLNAALCGGALAVVAWVRREDAALVLICGSGAVLQAVTAGCGVAFDVLQSQSVGVCDEGTGRPVRAAAGVLVLLVAAYVLRRVGDGRSRW
jgi:hypothetical protein